MNKKNIITSSNSVAHKLTNRAGALKVKAKKLAVTAIQKEAVRKKLVVTASKLAVTAKEKEDIRNKLVITAKQLAVTAKEKEEVRKKLAVVASEFAITAKEKENIRGRLEITAKRLATTAKDKEDIRRKLAVAAKEKEIVRRRLVVTAEKLNLKAKQLIVTAQEKEEVRKKLAVIASKLAITAKEKEAIRSKLVVTAEQLAVTAKEKEEVRKKLAVTAENLSLKAKQLLVTAKAKEIVRRRLAVTAERLAMTAKEKEIVREKLALTAKTLRLEDEKLAVFAENLAESKAKEEAILSSIGDGMVAADSKGRVLSISKATEGITGWRFNELKGKIFNNVVKILDKNGNVVPLQKRPLYVAFTTGKKVATAAYFYQKKDGTRFPVSIVSAPTFFNGKITGSINNFQNITKEINLINEKEDVRKKLAVTAKKLAGTAKDKEDIRKKLAVVAKAKESVRRRLAVTAEKLNLKAKQLVVTAKEKEDIRNKLVVTAEQLAVTAKDKEDIRKKLAAVAKEKESVRRRLVVTAEKLNLKAKQLIVTAQEKESVRKKLAMIASKLAITAKEKEAIRNKLVVTAEQLAVTAKEKENVRKKLAVTAEQLSVTAQEKEAVRKKLAVVAKEKENVRRKLALTAAKLKLSYKTLENKVIERTQNLERVKAKNEAMLTSIGDGLAVLDIKGNIIYINKSFEEMLGWKAQEVIGKSMVEIVPIEDQYGVRVLFKERVLTRVLAGERFIADLITPFYYIRKNKSKFPASTVLAPVVLDGKIIGAVETFRDITKEKEVDKAKSEFVSIASHQLRTPLTGIHWLTELLQKEKLTDKGQEFLSDIKISVQRLNALVELLLNISRIEEGKIEIYPESIDVVNFIKKIVDSLTVLYGKKKLSLTFVSDEKKMNTMTDVGALQNIAQAILANAFEYTPENGKIKVNLKKHGDDFLLTVSDTGIGIPLKDQNRIFQKFSRASNAESVKAGGMGMGLWITKQATELLGGKIWFKSQENKGTTFSVELPLKSKVIKGTKKLAY